MCGMAHHHTTTARGSQRLPPRSRGGHLPALLLLLSLVAGTRQAAPSCGNNVAWLFSVRTAVFVPALAGAGFEARVATLFRDASIPNSTACPGLGRLDSIGVALSDPANGFNGPLPFRAVLRPGDATVVLQTTVPGLSMLRAGPLALRVEFLTADTCQPCSRTFSIHVQATDVWCPRDLLAAASQPRALSWPSPVVAAALPHQLVPSAQPGAQAFPFGTTVVEYRDEAQTSVFCSFQASLLPGYDGVLEMSAIETVQFPAEGLVRTRLLDGSGTAHGFAPALLAEPGRQEWAVLLGAPGDTPLVVARGSWLEFDLEFCQDGATAGMAALPQTPTIPATLTVVIGGAQAPIALRSSHSGLAGGRCVLFAGTTAPLEGSATTDLARAALILQLSSALTQALALLPQGKLLRLTTASTVAVVGRGQAPVRQTHAAPPEWVGCPTDVVRDLTPNQLQGLVGQPAWLEPRVAHSPPQRINVTTAGPRHITAFGVESVEYSAIDQFGQADTCRFSLVARNTNEAVAQAVASNTSHHVVFAGGDWPLHMDSLRVPIAASASPTGPPAVATVDITPPPGRVFAVLPGPPIRNLRITAHADLRPCSTITATATTTPTPGPATADLVVRTELVGSRSLAKEAHVALRLAGTSSVRRPVHLASVQTLSHRFQTPSSLTALYFEKIRLDVDLRRAGACFQLSAFGLDVEYEVNVSATGADVFSSAPLLATPLASRPLPPPLLCPTALTVAANTGCGQHVFWTPPATPGPGYTLTSSAEPGAFFEATLSPQTVRYTSTDLFGQATSCAFAVHVQDTAAPSITCQSNLTATTDPGLPTASLAPTATATDNCPNPVLDGQPRAWPIGNHTGVSCATDAADNRACCSTKILVLDVEAPEIVGCPAILSGVATLASTHARMTWSIGVRDNSGSVSTASSPVSGSYFPVGDTAVVFEARDASGNQANCTFTVRVVQVATEGAGGGGSKGDGPTAAIIAIGGLFILLALVASVAVVVCMRSGGSNKEASVELGYHQSGSHATVLESTECLHVEGEAHNFSNLITLLRHNEFSRPLHPVLPLELKRGDVEVTAHIGAGSFGPISRACLTTGDRRMVVAAKEFSAQRRGCAEDMAYEAAVMAQLVHPNILGLSGVVTVEKPTLLLMEYCLYGSLLSYLVHAKGATPQRLRMSFARDIANGLAYLAGRGFVHQDVSARNTMVAEDLVCKISDFGISRKLDAQEYYRHRGGVKPLRWMAPEAYETERFTWRSDCWSYGIVLYEIWADGILHYADIAQRGVWASITDGHGAVRCPSKCPPSVCAIMGFCLSKAPEERPAFSDLAEFFRDEDISAFAAEEEGVVGEEVSMPAPPRPSKRAYYLRQILQLGGSSAESLAGLRHGPPTRSPAASLEAANPLDSVCADESPPPLPPVNGKRLAERVGRALAAQSAPPPALQSRDVHVPLAAAAAAPTPTPRVVPSVRVTAIGAKGASGEPEEPTPPAKPPAPQRFGSGTILRGLPLGQPPSPRVVKRRRVKPSIASRYTTLSSTSSSSTLSSHRGALRYGSRQPSWSNTMSSRASSGGSSSGSPWSTMNSRRGPIGTLRRKVNTQGSDSLADMIEKALLDTPSGPEAEQAAAPANTSPAFQINVSNFTDEDTTDGELSIGPWWQLQGLLNGDTTDI